MKLMLLVSHCRSIALFLAFGIVSFGSTSLGGIIPDGAFTEFNLNLTYTDHVSPEYPDFSSSTTTFRQEDPLGNSGWYTAFDVHTTAPTARGSTGSLVGSAFITDHHFGFGLLLNNEVVEESTPSLAIVWRSADTWILNPRDASAVLPNLPMYGNYTLHAKITYSGQPGADATEFIGGMEVELFAGIHAQTIHFDDDIPLLGGSNTINYDFGLKWSDGPDRTGRAGFEWRAGYFLGDTPSRLRVEARRSLILNSVTFSDGSAPEDHGFDLVFASGRASPNLSAVPEPSSALVWILGSGIVLGKRTKKMVTNKEVSGLVRTLSDAKNES